MSLESNPKVTVLYKFHATRALTLVKKLLFPNSPEDAKEWESNLNFRKNEIRKASLIIVSRRLIKNSVIEFKFTIGSGADLVVVGERYSAAKGLKKLQEAGILHK
jgi:hypothetical protein